ncbi:hypothetical protein VTN77DRAFT_4233 [Rasamsonia byssochlamydoides]|uniref:uncharacterized protein n=1 Tax=Rasamsonia byssochlamydoides TaxID=89139 RepID=UPI00374335CF
MSFLFSLRSSSSSALRSVSAAAAAKAAVAKAGYRTLTKQVQITTTPRPRNISESRLILKALQKFGEVVTFRHLRGNVDDPQATSLAIFETQESAARAIGASPLTVSIPKRINPPKSVNEHVLAADPLAKYDSIERPSKFTCEIQESHHDHEALMKENPYHGPFHIEDSFQYQDLLNSGIPHHGLADCSWASKTPADAPELWYFRQKNEMLGATSLERLYREGLDRYWIRRRQKRLLRRQMLRAEGSRKDDDQSLEVEQHWKS